MTYRADPTRINELIERSSLGTTTARAARASVPAATGQWVVQQVAQRRANRQNPSPA